MTVIPAEKNHSEDIARLLLLAMGDIVARFLQTEEADEAFTFMLEMVQTEHTQYSLENCWVAVEEEAVCGVICLYDGANLPVLRRPVAAYVERITGRAFNPEDETSAGEIYVDCVAVFPQYRGKGVASRLLGFIIGEHKGNTVGLLVDKPNAKKLYESLGFRTVGIKYLTGLPLEHMQLS